MPEKYIPFTEDELASANNVNLLDYLQRHRVQLKREGSSHRIVNDASLKGVTVHGNKWFDHYAGHGGGTIQFLQEKWGYTFQNAVIELLDGKYSFDDNSESNQDTESKTHTNKNPFDPPEKADSTKKVSFYLTQNRLLNVNVVNHFINEGKIYQDKQYGNVVFCGYDENNEMRFACKRGRFDGEKAYKGSVTGSDGNYSFNHKGSNKILCVFESAIDMMSYISMYDGKNDWRENSYMSLDGLAESPLLKFLENSDAECILLCFDHDEAGLEAMQKFTDILNKKGYKKVICDSPKYKDWNEQLKAVNGHQAMLGTESYQLTRNAEIINELKNRTPIINDMLLNCKQACAMLNDFLSSHREKAGQQNAAVSGYTTAEEVSVIYEKVMDLTALAIREVSASKEFENNDIFDYLENNYKAYQDKGNLKTKYECLSDEVNRLSANGCYNTLHLAQKLISVTIGITKGFNLSDLRLTGNEESVTHKDDSSNRYQMQLL